MQKIICSFLLLWLAGCPTALIAQQAVRIASMNLCTDELLLQLAAPQQIASLSYLVADPAYSTFARLADGYHLNHGLAEELLALHPDLVVTGTFSATLAANLLARLGMNIERLTVANSIAEVYSQIAQAGHWTGNTDQARHLTSDMQTRIAQYTAALTPLVKGKAAVFFSSNGYSYGSNTLQDSFIQSLGMRNAAATLNGPALLSLENLIAAAPDFVFINPPTALDSQLAHPLLEHRALSALSNHTRTIILSDTYFQCAGPQLIAAYATLSNALENSDSEEANHEE